MLAVPLAWASLALLGVALGRFGTLIGAGGGFLLVPLLLLLYPQEATPTITASSLAVVCLNASSGSLAYARLRRIDYRRRLVFAAAGIPGSIGGALATRLLPPRSVEVAASSSRGSIPSRSPRYMVR